MRGICKDCKEFKKLEKHSKVGGHLKPFVNLCAECHRKRHKITLKTKYPKKYAKGTKKGHKKRQR